ncbi:helix-turn-helix transcriptional regulator [Streptomyces hawaiiensis]|uniref:Transcriptional regulator n=1 Tax=Streptomyces hawaiiensis TaxID=67305 RepID=A0A6G5RLN8_9ACTN|nr:helix-turn-helix transcriptional regulator [Streptomyces hawaiiensis]QCD58741.1 transcriptional regulator [Streptomyces hawaiiensis]
MDRSSEIREFLRTRRARITPEQAGLAPHGGARRVPGLRREEVAQLAGVSVDYYVRLERGRTKGVSETVLDAVARALHLDETERAHLFDLTQPTPARTRRKRPLAPQRVHPVLYRTLDSLSVPAVVQGRRTDVLAANKLAHALYTDFEARPRRERNFARFVFLDEAARTLYADWEQVAGDCLALLRLYAGRHPDDPQLTELIGELSLHSDTFRRLWADHDVIAHTSGTKRLHHPLVGDLTLDYVVLAVEGDPEQTLVIYTPEPASPSAEALDILASWTSTSTTRPHTSGQTRNPVGCTQHGPWIYGMGRRCWCGHCRTSCMV